MLSSSSMKHHISNKALFKNFLFNYINFYDVCKDYLNLSANLQPSSLVQSLGYMTLVNHENNNNKTIR